MKKASVFLCLAALPLVGLASIACSDSATEGEAEADGGADARRGRSDASTLPDEDPDDDPPGPHDEPDASPDVEDCTDELTTPNLTGPEACGSIDFGLPAAPFTGVDAGDDSEMTGGTIPPGIYDLIGAERLSNGSGSWRETIVVGGGRFTRIRQIDTGSGPGPVTYRSGTISTNGNQLTLTEDCYVNGTTVSTPGASTLPYKVNSPSCGTTSLQYTATGLRFTLVPRKK